MTDPTDQEANSDLVELPLLCLPRTAPVAHIRALIRAERLPTPPSTLQDGTELVPLDYLDKLDPPDGPRPSSVREGPWPDHWERGIAQFVDGARRLPTRPTERRGAQLMRMGHAAWTAGLALLMCGYRTEAGEWLDRSACCYRRSLADAEPGSWGRSVASLKARLLGDDWSGARREGRWTLELGAAEDASPIARYAATLAALVLEENDLAASLAVTLAGEDAFPEGTTATGAVLETLARNDAEAYARTIPTVLRSFERRTRFLLGVPAADTVMVLQQIAMHRGLQQAMASAHLPA